MYWMASAAQMIKVRRSVTRLRHSLENRTGVHISVRMSEGGVGNLVNIDSRVHEMGVLAKASSAIVYEHIHKLWRRNLDKPEGAADPRAVPPNADKGGPDKEGSMPASPAAVDTISLVHSPTELTAKYDALKKELDLERALRRRKELSLIHI